jgi:hypothetical protein
MQNYSKILIERGWQTPETLNLPLRAPSRKNSQPCSTESVKLDELACSDVRDRMEASATQFGQPHACLFPLIGKRVATPRGIGRLITVFRQRCEVILDAEPERAACFRPDEVGLAV